MEWAATNSVTRLVVKIEDSAYDAASTIIDPTFLHGAIGIVQGFNIVLYRLGAGECGWAVVVGRGGHLGHDEKNLLLRSRWTQRSIWCEQKEGGMGNTFRVRLFDRQQ